MTTRANPPPREKHGERPPVSDPPEACTTPEPLQRLLDYAKGNPETQITVKEREAFTRELESIRHAVTTCSDRISDVLRELQRLKTADRVLADTHERCQQLSEEFYEREVLSPLFQGLIGIADRCRHQVRCIRQAYEKPAGGGDDRAKQALRHVLDARNADRIEVENLLAHYGVEAYRHRGERFDPSFQKCVGRIDGSGGATNHIGKRILPGYRRNGRVIRPEYVHVHVQNVPGQNKGEAT